MAFASIWAYALAAGLAAFGLTQAIAALTPPGALRLSLQAALIPVMALVAGVACESALAGLRSLFTSRHSRKQSPAING